MYIYIDLCIFILICVNLYWFVCIFIVFPEEKLWNNVLCGMVAGVVSSTIATPTDVLKVSSHFCR